MTNDNLLNSINNSLLTLLTTPIGSIWYYPTYGCDIYKLHLAQLRDSVCMAGMFYIRDSITKFEKRITITNIIYEIKGTSVVYQINYIVNNTNQNSQLSVQYV